MVKTRFTKTGTKFRTVFKALHDRFARSLTHRLITKTTNNEGHVTATSTADTIFKGDIQSGPELDHALIQAGYVEAGDAVLYVSATESEVANIVAKDSIIIEGTASGSHTAWTVVEILHKDYVKGDLISYVFRLTKRTPETIS